MSDSALNVQIPTELKREVKIQATKNDTTVREFVIVALKEKLARIEDENKQR